MLETRTVTSSLARKRASDILEGGAQRSCPPPICFRDVCTRLILHVPGSHDNNSDKGQRKRSRLEEAVGMKVDLA